MSLPTEVHAAFPTAKPYDTSQLQDGLSLLGYTLLYEQKTTSTMDFALTAEKRRAVVLTEHQTDGRGRWGRRWVGAPGNSVLMTVMEPFLEQEGDPGPASLLPAQLFTLSVCNALQETVSAQVQIRWPNDIVHDGKKLAGILVENPAYLPGKPHIKLFGLGMNVHGDDKSLPDTEYGAVSIDQISDTKLSREAIILAIIEKWSMYRVDLRAINNQNVWNHYAKLWRNAASLVGEQVEITDNLTTDGIQAGIVQDTPLGDGLLLQTSFGMQTIMDTDPTTKITITL
ncbi:MAG: biotin--[acetyl-CoA-carboxylase] ligase [bacterium]|nr:biotin--[acetyl-CoA-carboxylase] ligase [bacterium]